MDENVALDSNKQKQFVKSIKGIKKLIKKTEKEPRSENEGKVKDDKLKRGRRKYKERGLVYLSHIPHGFYENEMTQYFKQFGRVTNARVIRSKRTGNSKGCAFVEFSEPAVAQIVAETMNNYLMGKRLIKAAYVPPEKQKRHAQRKHWNSVNNPGNEHRLEMKKVYNRVRSEEEDLKRAKKIMKNIAHTKRRLRDLGINYDFFTPVDVPELLLNKAKLETGEDDSSNKKKQLQKPTKGKVESATKKQKLTIKSIGQSQKKVVDLGDGDMIPVDVPKAVKVSKKQKVDKGENKQKDKKKLVQKSNKVTVESPVKKVKPHKKSIDHTKKKMLELGINSDLVTPIDFPKKKEKIVAEEGDINKKKKLLQKATKGILKIGALKGKTEKIRTRSTTTGKIKEKIVQKKQFKNKLK